MKDPYWVKFTDKEPPTKTSDKSGVFPCSDLLLIAFEYTVRPGRYHYAVGYYTLDFDGKNGLTELIGAHSRGKVFLAWHAITPYDVDNVPPAESENGDGITWLSIPDAENMSKSFVLMRYDWCDQIPYIIGIYDPQRPYHWTDIEGDIVSVPDYFAVIDEEDFTRFVMRDTKSAIVNKLEHRIAELRNALTRIDEKSKEWELKNNTKAPWWNLGDIARAVLKDDDKVKEGMDK